MVSGGAPLAQRCLSDPGADSPSLIVHDRSFRAHLLGEDTNEHTHSKTSANERQTCHGLVIDRLIYAILRQIPALTRPIKTMAGSLVSACFPYFNLACHSVNICHVLIFFFFLLSYFKSNNLLL